MPKRRNSSNQWLDRHFNDAYVQRARADGYRSRAAYKLLELQERHRLLSGGMRVVDLGAAPGGWSQVAVPLVGRHGRVVALDILTIEPFKGLEIVQGDFRDDAVCRRLSAILAGETLDLVLSDMAPNLSGIPAVDQTRAISLCELALEFTQATLKPGGVLVVKSFHGEGFGSFLSNVRSRFERVVSRKPKASRPESREIYLVAKGYRTG